MSTSNTINKMQLEERLLPTEIKPNNVANDKFETSQAENDEEEDELYFDDSDYFDDLESEDELYEEELDEEDFEE